MNAVKQTLVTPNVGPVDSAIRIVVGIALIMGIFVIDAPWRWWRK